MPVLEEVLGTSVTGALARTAERLRQDQDFLDAQAQLLLADAACTGGGRTAAGSGAPGGAIPALSVELLARAHPAVRGRALRRAALAAGAGGGALAAAHVAALEALVAAWHGQGEAHLPGGVRAARECGKLVFRHETGEARGR
jgi:tRNA(Ile)-lysidine synthase